MTTDHFAEACLAKLSGAMDRFAQTICFGQVTTIEEYRAIVGRIAGLDAARMIIRETYAKMYQTTTVAGESVDQPGTPPSETQPGTEDERKPLY